ncbi:MAG: hypothetical protein AAFQ51_09630 [Pseudomonadota bacterium]
MNTTIALWLAGIILAIFAADHFVFGWDLWIFLGKTLARVSNWLAFWR